MATQTDAVPLRRHLEDAVLFLLQSTFSIGTRPPVPPNLNVASDLTRTHPLLPRTSSISTHVFIILIVTAVTDGCSSAGAVTVAAPLRASLNYALPPHPFSSVQFVKLTYVLCWPLPLLPQAPPTPPNVQNGRHQNQTTNFTQRRYLVPQLQWTARSWVQTPVSMRANVC